MTSWCIVMKVCTYAWCVCVYSLLHMGAAQYFLLAANCLIIYYYHYYNYRGNRETLISIWKKIHTKTSTGMAVFVTAFLCKANTVQYCWSNCSLVFYFWQLQRMISPLDVLVVNQPEDIRWCVSYPAAIWMGITLCCSRGTLNKMDPVLRRSMKIQRITHCRKDPGHVALFRTSCSNP